MSGSEPIRLTSHHRQTLDKIFQHPVAHNLEWNDVLSLLNAIFDVEEKHDGKYAVVFEGQTVTFEKPKHKDIDAQEVIDVRRLLQRAGFGPIAK